MITLNRKKICSIIIVKIVSYSLHSKTVICPLSIFYLLVPKTEENHRAYSIRFTIILLIWHASSWNLSKNYSICLNWRKKRSITLRISKLQRKQMRINDRKWPRYSNNVSCWVFIWMDLNQIGRKCTWQSHIFIYTFLQFLEHI